MVSSCRRKQTYLDLHVKCTILLPSFNKFGVSRQIFIEVPISNFNKISQLKATLIYTNERTDTQTDIERQTHRPTQDAFRDYMNAPKKKYDEMIWVM